jgi:PAS domain S-box-containing protein
MGHSVRSEPAEVCLLDVELGDAIEAMPDGIALHDTHGLRYVNPALAETLGCDDHAQVLGRPIAEFLVPTEAVAAEQSIAHLLAAGGTTEARKYHCRRLDGGVVLLEVWGARVLYRREAAALLVINDASARERRQRKLFLADRMATLGLLAAGVAHEVNNPLTYLGLTLSQLQSRLPTGRPVAALAARADEALVRIRDIMATLHTYAGSPSAPPAPISVNDAVEAALQMVAHRIRGRGRLVRDFADVPDVFANEVRLVQVFVNLLVNATDAIPEDHADDNEIRVRTDSDGNRISVEVSDTGEGIAPTAAEHVFELFFTTKPPGEGTGLGLPLSREIAESLGGTLTVESRKGKGTTARVVLPVASEEGESE